MKYHSHLNTAVSLLDQYKGAPPFGIFLKSFFKEHKKYGSSDRKNISRLCYAYFRLGKSLEELAAPEKIIAGLFMTATAPDEVLAFFQPGWDQWLAENDPHDWLAKTAFLQKIYPSFDRRMVFPALGELGEAIETAPFIYSHWQQPDLFLRVRPGQEKAVKRKLAEKEVTGEWPSPNAIRLPNSFPADQLFDINREVIIQDLSSQRIRELMQAVIDHLPRSFAAWDCCAASGGKSILLYDLAPNVDLTVSDVRPSILVNLKKRLQEAGIGRYHSFVSDLASASDQPVTGQFDLIMADVPCSGSGTWGRTPEQLRFFQPAEIEKYSHLQKKILAGVIPALKPGGYLLYSTCSVFRKENEDVVDFTTRDFGLTLQKAEYLEGYNDHADTMFGAIARRP